MTNLHPSGSEVDLTGAFEVLHPRVKRWIWDQQWAALRTVQAKAVEPVLAGDHDVIISAATASGKTEAAWLPIFSALASETPTMASVRALYISPLKALINDQFRRLSELAEALDIPINRRHGDVTGKERRNVERDPDGILLITPEALEALFVLRGTHIPRIFANLRYIVIDEMHSFIGNERGIQLQSLMHRIEAATRRKIPRIGLSATLADTRISRTYLRPNDADSVQLLDAPGEGVGLKMQLRGYIDRPDEADADEAVSPTSPQHSTSKREIAQHLYTHLRLSNNLIFANSRSNVEAYADLLAGISDDQKVPQEFFPHHGNLAKGLREFLEERLKAGNEPTTAICTSTLEMGIDIGSVESVAQIGAPFSVAATRQRLGRSGRRDQDAVLRCYISERAVDSRAHLVDRLRVSTVQAIAVLNLMLQSWYEPPSVTSLHLSTLVQQILSVIAQHGGANAAQLYRLLCQSGPFAHVDQKGFRQVLQSLGESDVLTQASDGTLLCGHRGEQIVNHYSFYTAFQVTDDYRIINAGHILGTLPVDYPLLIDSMILFAGRRWLVTSIDADSKTIEVVAASGGKAPRFSGSFGEIDTRIRTTMRDLYESDDTPVYLDAEAAQLLSEGRTAYQQARLSDIALVRSDNDTTVVAWRGSKTLNTISVILTQAGLENVVEGPAITFPHLHPNDLQIVAVELLERGKPDAINLATSVEDKALAKHDHLLSNDLQAAAYSAACLDVDSAWAVLETIPDLAVPQDATETDRPDHAPTVKDAVGETGYAVIDLETTGFSPQRGASIVEIGVVLLDQAGTEQATWSSLVKPIGAMGATHVHGISITDLDAAPAFGEVAAEVAQLLIGRIVVAHNAAFDIGFLTHEYARLGQPRGLWSVLCTRDLARHLFPGEPATLSAVSRRLGLADTSVRHRALADARTAASVLQASQKLMSVDQLQLFVTTA